MPENNDKIFCGNGKTWGQYGNIGVNLCLDQIPEEHITVNEKTGKRYVRLNIETKRQVDQWGNTHNVLLNTWKPENRA